MKVAILSDIHGNLTAMEQVYRTIKEQKTDAIIFLGDLIDYGMHSNEVVHIVDLLELPVLCNIWGNHERAIATGDFSYFSSKRGEECAKYTQSVLNDFSMQYIGKKMNKLGRYEFLVDGKKCLAVHGSLEDTFWKAIKPGQDLALYEKYDYVFSGHSHLPHLFEVFFQVDDEIHRNKKKTVFINPGSVGQPRNLCNLAQFAIWDTQTGSVSMEKVAYDIATEQAAYHGQVDDFYKNRLETGV